MACGTTPLIFIDPSETCTMAYTPIDKNDLPLTFGAFKPTGHVAVVFEGEEAGLDLLQAFRLLGLSDEELLYLSPAEVVERFKPLLPDSSGASGFGSEIQSMRQIYLLALEGNGMLVVHAPSDEATERIAETARRFNAKLAKKYNLLTIEELI
jgi:hypothetical protein